MRTARWSWSVHVPGLHIRPTFPAIGGCKAKEPFSSGHCRICRVRRQQECGGVGRKKEGGFTRRTPRKHGAPPRRAKCASRKSAGSFLGGPPCDSRCPPCETLLTLSRTSRNQKGDAAPRLCGQLRMIRRFIYGTKALTNRPVRANLRTGHCLGTPHRQLSAQTGHGTGSSSISVSLP